MFSGVTHAHKLLEKGQSKLYEGTYEKNGGLVVIKILNEAYPSIEQLEQFKHEFQILSSLNGKGTVKAYDIVVYQNTLAIIMGHYGNGNLQKILESGRLSVEQFLRLAISIINTLEAIHQQNIIHKDIAPSNILVNKDTLETKIIDFGIASTSDEPAQSRQTLEGAIQYISPEQTGRMNRGVDYRSDYYSIGMVFYQMATGQLPCKTKDLLKLVHYHIAKKPKAPHKIIPSFPKVISKIILKLLEKTAEDRYQSTLGIKYDLIQCLEQLNNTNTIKDFPLGQKDRSSRFNISEALYGREQEMRTLIKCFDHICTGASEFVVILGYAGVGKSRLVNEVQKKIAKKGGFFISGKFDQFKKNQPYSAFILAFQELIDHVLAMGDDAIQAWKEKTLMALGHNAQVLVDVVPQLANIIGPQPVPT